MGPTARDATSSASHAPTRLLRCPPRVPLACGLALLLGVLCDLPTRLEIYELSASALLSGTVAAVGVIGLPALLRGPNQHALAALLPFTLFVLWVTALALVFPLTIDGLQNLTIFWLFLATALTTAFFATPAIATRAQRGLILVGWILACMYALSLALDGIGAGSILGRRSFGIEALLIMAVAVPMVHSTHRSLGVRPLPWVLGVLIAASLSRTAMAVAVLFLAVRFAMTHRGVHLVRLGAMLAVGVWMMIVAIQRVPLLRERFTGGDQAFNVEGFTLSLQGRDRIWGAVLRGVDSSPYIGQGPGSVKAQVLAYMGTIDEPHNDFLRALHDTGWIGLSLLLFAIATLLTATVRRARRATDTDERATHIGAVLALVAFIFGCLTDNPMVYAFFMAPLGLIVGLSLARPPWSDTTTRDV